MSKMFSPLTAGGASKLHISPIENRPCRWISIHFSRNGGTESLEKEGLDIYFLPQELLLQQKFHSPYSLAFFAWYLAD